MKKKKIKALSKREAAEYIIIGLLAMLMILMIKAAGMQEYEYHRYETASIHYSKARVIEILEQELTLSGSEGEYFLGKQTVIAELLEGGEAGKLCEIDNYVTVQHNVIVKKGSHVIVCADVPENGEPYYTIYNYDRSNAVYGLLGCFLLVVIVVGRKKGFYSCMGLLFTIIMVVSYLLPQLYKGSQAVAAAGITVVVSTAVGCFCIGGCSKKTIINSINTVLGTFLAGIIYAIFSRILQINGCSMDEAEALVLISQTTGLELKGVLFAGIMIISLGAVMDVAVSVGAALFEIAKINEKITVRELFQSGMNIGRDMIGTMTNTLILAFTGSALTTLIVFISYGVQYHQLLSSNYLVLEIAKGLAGSLAVVLTVPISAIVCALCYGKHKRMKKK